MSDSGLTVYQSLYLPHTSFGEKNTFATETGSLQALNIGWILLGELSSPLMRRGLRDGSNGDQTFPTISFSLAP